MALSVDYLYQYSLKLIKKNQAGGLDSVEWAYHWNDAQNSYMGDLLGRFQQNSNGKSGANTGLIENETILSKLSPFTKNANIPISGGKAVKPSDFIYTLAIRASGKNVEHINHNQRFSVENSVIDPPSVSEETYYHLEHQGYYDILPAATPSVDLDYISTPPNVLWNFSLDGSNRKVYNSVGSVQSLWDDLSNREITKRMLTTIGVSYKDADFFNFGAKVQQQGE